MSGLFNKHAPIITKKVKGKVSPWLTPAIKTAMNDRDKLLRKSRKSKKDEDVSAYKRKRNIVNNMIRKSKSSYHRRLLQENSNDPDRFWRILKTVYPSKVKHNSTSKLFEISGEKTDDPERISNGFCQFFSNVANKLKALSFPLLNLAWRRPKALQQQCYSSFRFKYVSRVEIEKHLKSLKRKKAAGIDDLPANLLRDAAPEIASPLSKIINLSLCTSIFPNDWKHAKVVPIYKSGKVKIFDNYRPISLLPVVSKITEKVVHTRLMEHLETLNLLSPTQFGFRQNRSTESAAILFVDSIRKAVDKGEVVGTVFIDLSKAFDTISHANLLKKLPQFGIRGAELEWFTDYLFCRKQTVCYNGILSHSEFVTCGVPQGSILGPLLFLILFNDIGFSLRKARIIKYADDSVIFFSNKDYKVVENCLNENIEMVAEWFEDNDMIPNLKVNKTECMLFGTPQKLAKLNHPTLNLNFRHQRINHTSSYKYLGNVLTTNLNINDQFDINYRKFAGRLNLLRRLRHMMDVKSALAIYNSMLRPIFNYCSLLSLKLNVTQKQKLESLTRRASQIVMINNNNIKLPSIENSNKLSACLFVRKCLDKSTDKNFHGYFTEINHTIATRNNNCGLIVPKIRTEFGKCGFFFQGAITYNSLPITIRRELDIKKFKNLVREHFLL